MTKQIVYDPELFYSNHFTQLITKKQQDKILNVMKRYQSNEK